MTWEEEMQTYAIVAAKKAEAKGRAEGIIEGKLESARKLKLKGMSIEDIIDVTGLTAEQVARV